MDQDTGAAPSRDREACAEVDGPADVSATTALGWWGLRWTEQAPEISKQDASKAPSKPSAGNNGCGSHPAFRGLTIAIANRATTRHHRQSHKVYCWPPGPASASPARGVRRQQMPPSPPRRQACWRLVTRATTITKAIRASRDGRAAADAQLKSSDYSRGDLCDSHLRAGAGMPTSLNRHLKPHDVAAGDRRECSSAYACGVARPRSSSSSIAMRSRLSCDTWQVAMRGRDRGACASSSIRRLLNGADFSHPVPAGPHHQDLIIKTCAECAATRCTASARYVRILIIIIHALTSVCDAEPHVQAKDAPHDGTTDRLGVEHAWWHVRPPLATTKQSAPKSAGAKNSHDGTKRSPLRVNRITARETAAATTIPHLGTTASRCDDSA